MVKSRTVYLKVEPVYWSFDGSPQGFRIVKLYKRRPKGDGHYVKVRLSLDLDLFDFVDTVVVRG